MRGRRMILARSVLLAASLGLASSNSIRLHAVAVRGDVQPATREVTGTITTEVRTPLGNVPVTGRVHAHYRCDATFSGTLTYGAFIHLLARIRRATLVNVMEGRMDSGEPWDCRVAGDRIAGHFTFADTALAGHLVYGGDTIPVSGFAWPRGEKQFHSVLSVRHSSRGYTVRVELAER
jgi:hypothetical protein